MQINKSVVVAAVSFIMVLSILAIANGVYGASLKRELASSKKALSSESIAHASTTQALASTTAKTAEEYKILGEQLGFDSAERSAILGGYSDFFLLRRYLTSTTTLASRSQLVIPKGCPIVKAAQQGGYGDSDKSQVLTLAYVRDTEALNLYNSGRVDIYEVNCVR